MLDIVIIILVLFNIAITLYVNMALAIGIRKPEPIRDFKHIHNILEPINNNMSTAVKEKKISEIPPDVLAPVILKPPRPAGGFGSKVSDNQEP